MRPTFLCHHSPEEKKKLTVRNTDIPLGILKYRNLLFRLGKTSHISMNSKTGYNLQYAFFYQSQPKKKKAQRHTERQAMSAISWRSQPLPHQHTPFHSLASPKDMSEGRHCPQHTFPHTHTETCWPLPACHNQNEGHVCHSQLQTPILLSRSEQHKARLKVNLAAYS